MESAMTPRTARTALTLLLFVGLAAEPSRAQQYKGDGGTLLDRNLQVGSGGKNPRARDIRDQIWFNNQVITGNAPGGRSFRGYVGYSAASDFRGTAGSDSLYSFQRDSTSAAQVATGVRASDALRYQMSLTTGQTAPAYLANTYITRRDSEAATGASVTSTSSALRSTADFLSSRSLRPTLVRSGTDPDGREWTLTASPLVGFSKIYLDAPATAQPVDPLAPAPITPGAPSTPSDVNPTVTPGAPAAPTPTSYRPSGLESRGVNFQSNWQQARVGDVRPAGNALSRTLDTGVAPTAVVTRSATHAQTLDAIRRAYGESPTAPATEPPAPGQVTPDDQEPKSYADRELERIRRVLRGLPPTEPPKVKPAADQPSAQPDPNATPAPTAPSPTGAPADPSKLLAVAAGVQAGPTGEKDKDKPAPVSPEILRALRALGEKSLDSLMPSATAQNEPEVYRVHMAAAESALRDGRFFEAEDRFTRAIAAMPADAMAKAGRVQAQLGAGLYLSASTNLRQLLSANPEVVGIRLDPKLAPDPERAKQIAGQLRTEIDQGSTGMGLEASLLLTQLGRATGDQAMVDEGLKAMSTRLPADDPKQATLYELLQGVWGSPK